MSGQIKRSKGKLTPAERYLAKVCNLLYNFSMTEYIGQNEIDKKQFVERKMKLEKKGWFITDNENGYYARFERIPKDWDIRRRIQGMRGRIGYEQVKHMDWFIRTKKPMMLEMREYAESIREGKVSGVHAGVNPLDSIWTYDGILRFVNAEAEAAKMSNKQIEKKLFLMEV
jgi:predicted dehydrogenase